ncbi:MAG TPA: hypothetical protein IAC74_01180 [Candidatus Aphodoplasma excrementigallinarum]|uniref:Uncharacterized protein n=1 Tax=Candidatus Aphodoplasma excrementigallinarum TaxID=2840673 RepID=A0A9D1SZN5_9FIRM|nr:hypothetical protein [Candidatus Aphodoplasma excrementigallinarum]
MLQRGLQTQEIGTTEYTDSKQQRHRVKHSVVFSDCEKHELTQKVAEDLYSIFTSHAGRA